MSSIVSNIGCSEAFARRFLARLPPELGASFSQEQLLAVQRVFGMRYAVEHALDVRRSVPLPWGRYYVILLAGRDRPCRGRVRLARLALFLCAATALAVALRG